MLGKKFGSMMILGMAMASGAIIADKPTSNLKPLIATRNMSTQQNNSRQPAGRSSSLAKQI